MSETGNDKKPDFDLFDNLFDKRKKIYLHGKTNLWTYDIICKRCGKIDQISKDHLLISGIGIADLYKIINDHSCQNFKKPDFNIYKTGSEKNPEFYFLNILAFLCQMLHDDALSTKDPAYIIDKFQRYCIPGQCSSHAFLWGLHPTIFNNIFMKYCEHHKLDITDCITHLSKADKEDLELVEWIKSIQAKNYK